MINEPLVYFEHEDAFNAQVNAGNITNGAQNEQVIFLGDSKKILTHGKEFGSGKIYTEGDGIQIDASNVISQRVTSSNKLGGIKTGYAASGRNFAVSVDNNGNAYVNVPEQQIDIPEYTPYDDQWIHDALDTVDGQIDGLEEDLDGINNWSEQQISDIVTNRLDTWEWLTRGVIFEQNFTEDSDGENSEDPTKYGFLLSYGTGGGPSKTNYQVVDGVLQCQSQINAGEGGRSGAATAVFNEIGLGNYLYLSYKWSLGQATGDNSQAYTKTSIGNAAGKALELAFYGQEGRLLVNGQEVLRNTNIRNTVYNVTATINLNRQKITSLQMTCSNTNYNYGTTEEFSFKDAITTIDRFTFENSTRATWTNTSSIDDVLITFEGEFGQSGWNSALATWMSLNGYVTKDSAEWTEIVQRMDGIEATANYVYKVVDSEGNVKWETLSSGLGLSVIPELQQSVATLTAMWADGTDNDQALDWLLAGFRASANGDSHTAMTQMFATTSYADNAATAAVNAITNNYYTKAEIGTLFNENLAGVVTTSDLDSSVASLFAEDTETSTKAIVSAMVEDGVSSIVLSADQIATIASQITFRGADLDAMFEDTGDDHSRLFQINSNETILTMSDRTDDQKKSRATISPTEIEVAEYDDDLDTITNHGIVMHAFENNVDNKDYIKFWSDYDEYNNKSANLVITKDAISTADLTDSNFTIPDWHVGMFLGKDANNRYKLSLGSQNSETTHQTIITPDGVDTYDIDATDITANSITLGENDDYQVSISNSAEGFEFTTADSDLNRAVTRIGAEGIVLRYDGTWGDGIDHDILILGPNPGVSDIIDYPTGGGYDPGTIKCYDLIADAVVANSVQDSSDRTLKNIIEDTNLSVEQIAEAPSVIFSWKKDATNKRNAGTIAQYWYSILPEVVGQTKNGTLTLQYGNAAMVAAVTTAKEVVALKEEVAELKRQIAELMSK